MAKKMTGLCAIYAKTKEYKQLKQELLDDLQARGLISKPYIDMVDSYMRLWCQEQMLDADVAERGVYVEYQNGANQKGTTDNKSVEKLIRTMAQKTTIWAALGFREQANSAKSIGGDDDEL